MRHRTAKETHHQNRGVLRSAGSENFPASAGSILPAGDMEILLIIVVVAVIGIIGWRVYRYYHNLGKW